MNNFADRCRIAQECLPDAEYRQRLTALHDEMLAAMAKRDAVVKAAVKWGDTDTEDEVRMLASELELSNAIVDMRVALEDGVGHGAASTGEPNE